MDTVRSVLLFLRFRITCWRKTEVSKLQGIGQSEQSSTHFGVNSNGDHQFGTPSACGHVPLRSARPCPASDAASPASGPRIWLQSHCGHHLVHLQSDGVRRCYVSNRRPVFKNHSPGSGSLSANSLANTIITLAVDQKND